MNVEWFEDQPTEKRLQEFGIKVTKGTIKFEDIDWKASRENGARFEKPIDDDLVAEYCTAMEQGDKFPMTVVLMRKGKLALILSGNHRLPAAKNTGASSAKCYLVESEDAAIIDLLPRVLNRMHGKRQGREEAMHHALHAVSAYGYDPRKAAEIFGLPKESVADEIRCAETKVLLEKNSIRCDNLPKTSLRFLHTLAGMDQNALISAARLAVARNLPSPQIGEFTKNIRKQKTEAQRHAVIAEMEKNTAGMDPGPAIKIPRQVRSKFIGWLTSGLKYNATNLNQLQITDKHEQETIRDRIRDLHSRLGVLLFGRGKKGHEDGHRKRA